MEVSGAAERLGGHELELVRGTQPPLVGFKRERDRRVHQGADAPAKNGRKYEGPPATIRSHQSCNNNRPEAFSEIVKQSKYCKGRGSGARSRRVREAGADDWSGLRSQ